MITMTMTHALTKLPNVNHSHHCVWKSARDFGAIDSGGATTTFELFI